MIRVKTACAHHDADKILYTRNRSHRKVSGNCVREVHPGHEPFLY